MKFSINQKDLMKVLNPIKSSKALAKSGDEKPILQIKSEDKTKITFRAYNTSFCWASSEANSVNCNGMTVEGTNAVFVEGNEFINLIGTYDPDSNLDFYSDENEVGDITLLNVKCEQGDGNLIQSGFASIKPDFFQENPPDEETKTAEINTSEMIAAVNAVEFATGSVDAPRYLWGVQIEVYSENDIAAFATDKAKMCWYDKVSIIRDNAEPFIFCPLKAPLMSAIKGLDSNKTTSVRVGNMYTTFDQGDVWHSIPNITQTKDESLPVWRPIINNITQKCSSTVLVPREKIVSFIKTATSSSVGKIGVKIDFDSEGKKVVFSIDSVDVSSVSKTSHSVKIKLPSESFLGDSIKDSLAISIDSLKEIVNRLKSDTIEMKVQDGLHSVRINGTDSVCGLLTTTFVCK